MSWLQPIVDERRRKREEVRALQSSWKRRGERNAHVLESERYLLRDLEAEKYLLDIKERLLDETYSVQCRVNYVDGLPITTILIVKPFSDKSVPEIYRPIIGITANSDGELVVDDPRFRLKEHFWTLRPWERRIPVVYESSPDRIGVVYGRQPTVLSGNDLTGENLKKALYIAVEEGRTGDKSF